MTKDANHGPLWVIGIKSLVFTVVTVLATGILAMTIRNSSSGEAVEYTAVFADATSVNRGDDVRVAGVKVGTVLDVAVTEGRLARVRFTIRKGVPVERGAVIQINFRNLVGQRYLAIKQPGSDAAGTTAGDPVPASAATMVEPGHTFGLEETRPALSLTVLFNGFRPLMRLLDSDDVNALSEQILAVFQGEAATVEGLLESTAGLTTTLAEKDEVIGQLITSLSSVMQTVNSRSGQLDTTVRTMQQLVSGLAADRAAIGGSIEGLGELTDRVAGLLGDTRPSVRRSIEHLGTLSETLDQHSTDVERFLNLLPTKLDRIGRTASYGSWLNFYLCSMDGRIPLPEGYMGDVGVKPVAGRCR
ncbi:MCE family protein [Nocardioides lianchengensis]|uniref:Phospholipid/cholesterol/gamma-HCH transport system substrate-binding protein n=1 Tax=Nocardioides lianchengensis TaxID=1045774 RepID=A0A1G7B668_9ACTN|nr:MlaD family protein [Nocardioides lianchengensis]NYG10102.1 phospholipid/cholesterol/gamma-HCH transport system substrate-binding protein [Nocardioides lianchengensis]SDE22531.1 phospholipid/cholesterol/gamma-HCH transport system substrate-binding protein [Nocardioides lianchengensis]